MPSSRLTVATWLVFIALIAAIDLTRADEKDKGPKVSLVVLSESGVIRDLSFENGGTVEKLSVYSRGFAPPVKYRGPQHLVFFRPIDPALGFDKDREIVGQVDLPANAESVMLLFKTTGNSEKEAYEIFAFDNDLRRFPAGGYRIFNTTREPVICWLAKNRFELAPKDHHIATADGDENGNVTLRIYRQEKGELTRIYSSVWQVKDTRRTTVFLTPSGTRVQEISVSKFVEPIVPEREAN
ncbi:MAG: hypothetical protein KDN19_06265 [Verrucomicrobiae bacterium]|nr:hypothetical protein [Verrucomicrobiae bacterium]